MLPYKELYEFMCNPAALYLAVSAFMETVISGLQDPEVKTPRSWSQRHSQYLDTELRMARGTGASH